MAKKNQATLALEALPMAERSERRIPPSPKVAPWLVIPHGKGRKNQAFYNPCEPDNKTHRKFIPELSGKSFCQKPCHQGWLVIRCSDKKVDYTPTWNYGDCFLWNPTTLETIQLPNILSPVYTFNRYGIVDCVLCLPPKASTLSTNPGDGNDSLVVFLFRALQECNYVFLFCRPGDQQWRTQELSRDILDNITSLHYLRGNLYAMGDNMVLKIEIEKVGNVNLIISLFEPECLVYIPYIGGIYTSGYDFKYVQTCDEELYKFTLGYSRRSFMKEVISIEVVKLDFSLMVWKEVSSFGDHVLFFGYTTIACCSAAELGLNGGCLYYTLPEDQSLYKFELEGTSTIILPCLKLQTPWFSSDWIMMPTTSRVSADGQQKIEDEDYIINLGVQITSSSNKNQEEVYNIGEVKQQKPWCILDMDSVKMIASYLHPIDYKQFRLVCRANRSNLPIVKPTITSKRIISNTYVSPWLVYCTKNGCNVYNYVDPMHNNEKYFMKLPMLRGATIRFQMGGWILMSKRACRLFFHNPFTKESIELPDLPECYRLTNISFSSLPTCFDCVVFATRVCDNGGIAVYIIARGEKSWRYQEFGNIDTDVYYMPLLNTPALYKGNFYCVDYNGLLGAFSLGDGISWSYKVLGKPHKTFNAAYPSFLVECGGDLLLVKLGRIGKFEGIYKMDFSEMQWVGVKSLGKYMLFISYTSCVSSMAPCTGMENKIYFPRLSLDGEGILFYSLDTGRYHSFGSRHSSTDFYDTKGWSSWSWIEPNWSRSTIQELDWFTTLP